MSEKNGLRYGMVGGGEGSLIGDVHRKAIALDDSAALVCGCFSRSYDNTLKTGKGLGLDEDRLYEDYQEMAEKEAGREDPIDFVAIVTPNNTHYPIAKAFLERGINVVCDKPLTVEVEQGEELEELARENDLLFGVTYTYSGYPMVKQAREMVRNGDLGEIRVVMGEYPQDWLATPLEETGMKQASWRTDPERSGKSNCVGDIGSHIEHTVSYITGLEIESLCANLDIFVEGRKLDDNGEVMLKYKSGASGLYWASQVAVGHENGLRVRIYGTKGAIEWFQEKPNHLHVNFLDKPEQIMTRGNDYVYPLAADNSRIPPGHPEGYFEAFANIYRNYCDALVAKKAGEEVEPGDYDYPDVQEGVNGVKFIESCVESSQKGAEWVDFK